MRDVSSAWDDNQLEDVSVPSVLSGFIETRDGVDATRWYIGNLDADNVIEAAITHEFDYTRASVPMCESSVTIENGAYADEDNSDYDFLTVDNQLLMERPGSIDINIGYSYSDPAVVETIPLSRHLLTSSTVMEDGLSATFKGSSFGSILDDGTFYGGRYVAGGIPASTLFSEILEDAAFPPRGWWSYVIGDANCVVSDTQPIWTSSGFSYYTIDSAFDSIMVEIPIPPVTHREALTMLAAYVGAYVIERSDGSLDIVSELVTPRDHVEASSTYYFFDEYQVYDRPTMTSGDKTLRVSGSLYSYSVDTTSTTKAFDSDIILTSTDTQTVQITHEAVANGSLSITGGTISGSPTYNTYSTVFTVIPASTTVHVTLTANQVTIDARDFTKEYAASGNIVSLDCQIASDPSLALAMYDHYVATSGSVSYQFTMRDNPCLECGDRVMAKLISQRRYSVWNYIIGDANCIVSDTQPLQTTYWDSIIPVVITSIKRSYNGGVEATYTVSVDVDQ